MCIMTSSAEHNHGNGNVKQQQQKTDWNSQMNVHRKCSQRSTSPSNGKADSVLSSDSYIRFTRRKMGDSQKCGCAVFAGFLVFLLFASVAAYLGYVYSKLDTKPDRIFSGKLRVRDGDIWTMELADQTSLRFLHKASFYQSGFDAMMRQSDLKEGFQKSEVLALDGTEDDPTINVHFHLHFDPYRMLVSTADLVSVMTEQLNQKNAQQFENITFDVASMEINELSAYMVDMPSTCSASLGRDESPTETPTNENRIPRRCEIVRLPYCASIGYNITTYPNLLNQMSINETIADLIAFREIVDSECSHQAYDFVCRMLQPPCHDRGSHEPDIGMICRDYCMDFQKECGRRIPERFKPFFDCERFPESTGIQSCHARPNCVEDLQTKAMSNRLCDGIADCPDLSDEIKCSYCPLNSLYCGRGRACIPRTARCDGKLDCPDGSDERDCLSIAPLISELNDPKPLTPQQARFHSEGFAIFSEKGESGKLCTEGLTDETVRHNVAESLCKTLGYEKMQHSEFRNDTENNTRFVRVLDPKAAEISFVRTTCEGKEALHVSCSQLECGIQSMLTTSSALSLPKMAAPGDWPWHVTLHREDTHVCDGTLVSDTWVLTTDSCFQGQAKATWMAAFGNIRLGASTPWMQRRRIIGMVKSPVEGSTAALIRLETAVVFSDFIRPICLPDILKAADAPASTTAEPIDDKQLHSDENRDFFIASYGGTTSFESDEKIFRKSRAIPDDQIDLARLLPTTTTNPTKSVPSEMMPAQWTMCNTLGWSRPRDHLQRVQLKMNNMAACENISIATVNSMCTEATFHKQDCTEEEFAGAPVMCLSPDSNRWALVGIASWRIACAPSGIERPRMYDKITPNSAWIRRTISAS